MAHETLASTVEQWRNHWVQNPSRRFDDYRKEWADIQNRCEQPKVKKIRIGAGTASKYLKMFRAEPIPVTVAYASFDSIAELHELQTKIAEATYSHHKSLQRLQVMAEQVEFTIGLLSDSRQIDNLLQENQGLLDEIELSSRALADAKEQYTIERNRRILSEQTHGEATGR